MCTSGHGYKVDAYDECASSKGGKVIFKQESIKSRITILGVVCAAQDKEAALHRDGRPVAALMCAHRRSIVC